VTVGKRADLLLVERNPLQDLSTLKTPLGVMVRGRWLPREHSRDVTSPSARLASAIPGRRTTSGPFLR
jgi:hypothetical protein